VISRSEQTQANGNKVLRYKKMWKEQLLGPRCEEY